MIRILDLFVTKQKLRRMHEFDGCDGAEDGGFPPLLLAECPDGRVEVRDGHRRLAYYRLCGREYLAPSEYWVIHVDEAQPRFGTIDDVLSWNGLTSGMAGGVV